MKKILTVLLAALLIAQAGMFTAFADNTEIVAADENSTKLKNIAARIAIEAAKANLVENSSGTDPVDPCAEGHAWNSEPTVDKPATCTEAGLQSFHCSRCDATQEATIIPPLGHQWNTTYTVDVPATETAAGSQSIHCSVCGAIKDGSTQIIPQTAIIDLPTVKISKPSAGKKKVTVKWKKVNKKNLKKIERLEIQVATDPHFTNIVKTADVSKKKTSKTIKGLTSKHTYYVQIRAYKNAADGRHVSQWRAKRVKTK